MKGGILRIVRVFRLFLGIEVIKVPVKLVEAVDGGQEFIAVAEVVLTNLSGGAEHDISPDDFERVVMSPDARARADPQGAGRLGIHTRRSVHYRRL